MVQGQDLVQVLFLREHRGLLLNRHVGEVMAFGNIREARVYLFVLQSLVLGRRLTASLTAFIAAVLLRKRLLRTARLVLDASLGAGTDDV